MATNLLQTLVMVAATSTETKETNYVKTGIFFALNGTLSKVERCEVTTRERLQLEYKGRLYYVDIFPGQPVVMHELERKTWMQNATAKPPNPGMAYVVQTNYTAR